jgi:DnaK suppressor protein
MTNTVDPHLPPDYIPSEKEPYMSQKMLAYFRRRLLDWRDELLAESETTLDGMREEGGIQEPDITDRATVEIDHGLELRTRDRYRKLINKIEQALERIEQGEYGFCEETGEPIGVKRLLARPNATLSIEAQERHEREEKVKRDD